MTMTRQQSSAAIRLQKALDNCHKHGLRGGVYESTFRVWPVVGPCPMEAGRKFFEVIEERGMTLYSPMVLDGGAGV
jgi:hypothetical protein